MRKTDIGVLQVSVLKQNNLITEKMKAARDGLHHGLFHGIFGRFNNVE